MPGQTFVRANVAGELVALQFSCEQLQKTGPLDAKQSERELAAVVFGQRGQATCD